jgi:hypothetical protein
VLSERVARLRVAFLRDEEVWSALVPSSAPEQHTVAVFFGARFNRPEALQPLFWLRDRILPELAQ